MTDAEILHSWTREMTPGADLVVHAESAGEWRLVAERRVSAAEGASTWAAPEGGTDVLVEVVGRVASAFPLVAVDVVPAEADRVVRFTAPAYEEGLSRQEFVLTASSVVRAALAFDAAAAVRARAVGDLARVRAKVDQVVHRLGGDGERA